MFTLGSRKFLDNQWPLQIGHRFRSYVFNSTPPIGAEEIEPKTVLFRINEIDEATTESGPLRWIDITFKDRVLNPLAVVETCLRDHSQPLSALFVNRADIIADKDHHGSFPEKRRICVQISPDKAG